MEEEGIATHFLLVASCFFIKVFPGRLLASSLRLDTCMYIHVHTMYIHVHVLLSFFLLISHLKTCTYMYVHTMYIHVHVYTLYIHVYMPTQHRKYFVTANPSSYMYTTRPTVHAVNIVHTAAQLVEHLAIECYRMLELWSPHTCTCNTVHIHVHAIQSTCMYMYM